MIYEELTFKRFTDGRGDLVPLEIGADIANADIPFDVKRCYFISVPTNEDNAIRGRHAHLNIEQVIICMNGSFTLDLDNGMGERASVRLASNSTGIHIKGLIWRELRGFSEDCVILVLASEHYSEDDYIRDYDEFVSVVNP